MNRDILKQIIIDQKEMYLDNPLIFRDYDLEENLNPLNISHHNPSTLSEILQPYEHCSLLSKLFSS